MSPSAQTVKKANMQMPLFVAVAHLVTNSVSSCLEKFLEIKPCVEGFIPREGLLFSLLAG
jgi:hypothetical protein